MDKKQNSIYSFLLNNTGRIIGDLFVHKFFDDEQFFLIELDQTIMPAIYQWVKRFRIRRKLKITNETNNWKCSVLFPEFAETVEDLPLNINDNNELLLLNSDPRNYHFGYRMLSRQLITLEMFSQLLHSHGQNSSFVNECKISASDQFQYHSFRYRYGIGEGSIDFPMEGSFPFESNGDLSNAVSFDKGQYIVSLIHDGDDHHHQQQHSSYLIFHLFTNK